MNNTTLVSTSRAFKFLNILGSFAPSSLSGLDSYRSSLLQVREQRPHFEENANSDENNRQHPSEKLRPHELRSQQRPAFANTLIQAFQSQLRPPPSLRAGTSGDPRSSEPDVLPAAGQLDAATWTELPEAMTRFAVARTRQGLAFRAQFGTESAKHHSGSCLGMTATWIRLHQAASNAGAVDRLNLVGSFEGMSHAQFYQHAYEADRDDLLKSSRVRRAAKKSPNSIEAWAQQTSSQAWGMGVQAMTGKQADALHVANALEDFSGYGMLPIRMRDAQNKHYGHVAALYREPGSDKLSLFDPDLGEFELPVHEVKGFLEAYADFQTRNNCPVTGFDLLAVQIQTPIQQTPLASLAGHLVG